MFFFASSPEVGADRILRLAFSPDFEGVTGEFIYEDKIKAPNPEALDDELVDKIWELSKRHVGLPLHKVS